MTNWFNPFQSFWTRIERIERILFLNTNYSHIKHQNAREIIHIYDSLTLKYSLFRFFGCKINRNQWYLPNLATIQPNSTLNDISSPKIFSIHSSKILFFPYSLYHQAFQAPPRRHRRSKINTPPSSMQAHFVNASIHFAVYLRTCPYRRCKITSNPPNRPI